MRFLFIVLLAFTLVRIGTSCDNNQLAETSDAANEEVVVVDAPADSAADQAGTGSDLKPVKYEEIKADAIEVRGNERMAVYSLPSKLVFTAERDEISLNVKQDLKQIANSIKKRFPDGWVYLYSGSQQSGKATPNQNRATEVKNWLVVHENLDAARVFHVKPGEVPVNAPDPKGIGSDGYFQIVAVNPR